MAIVDSVGSSPLSLLRFAWTPFPVTNLRQVLAVPVDVLLVLNQFILHLLFEVRPLGAQVRQAIDHVLNQVEPVQVVLYSDVKGRGDGALFLVAADVEVAVGPAIGQPVDQPWVSVKAKNDVLISGE